MANLTGQQIKDTYPGLLNLNVATTGVTSTPQAITDGLGNNTGNLIATNFLYNPSLLGVRSIVPDFIGPGMNTGASVPPTGNTNNNVYFFPFFDMGYLSYSAITTVITNVTSTSDVMNMYIYNSQYLSGTGFGLMPFQQIYSGTTLPTTGAVNSLRTTSLTGTTTFSGSGAGIYWLAINITNAGVTPTFRYGGTPNIQSTLLQTIGGAFYGVAQAIGTVILGANTSKANIQTPFTITGGVKSSYTSSDVTTGFIAATTNALPFMGYAFNVVK